MNDTAKQYIRLVLQASDDYEAAELAEIERPEREGFRIAGAAGSTTKSTTA